MNSDFVSWCFSLRLWLFHERAFRLTPAQQRRFSIQAQYDANETFRNLLQWTGTTLEVICFLKMHSRNTSKSAWLLQFIFWKPITWIFLSCHFVGFFVTRALRMNCPVGFNPANCTYDRSSIFSMCNQSLKKHSFRAAGLRSMESCLRIFPSSWLWLLFFL